LRAYLFTFTGSPCLVGKSVIKKLSKAGNIQQSNKDIPSLGMSLSSRYSSRMLFSWKSSQAASHAIGS
jgi:hypothetical protein